MWIPTSNHVWSALSLRFSERIHFIPRFRAYFICNIVVSRSETHLILLKGPKSQRIVPSIQFRRELGFMLKALQICIFIESIEEVSQQAFQVENCVAKKTWVRGREGSWRCADSCNGRKVAHFICQKDTSGAANAQLQSKLQASDWWSMRTAPVAGLVCYHCQNWSRFLCLKSLERLARITDWVNMCTWTQCYLIT